MNEWDSTESYKEPARSNGGYKAEEHLSGKSTQELEEEIDRIREDMSATLSAIERKFSPGELLDRTLHSLKGGPTDYINNLGEAVRANPIPSALVGIGLGWLMFSEGQHARGGATYSSSGGSSGGKMHEGLESAKEKMGETKGKISESTSHMKERVSHMAHSVSEKMHHAGERMHGAGDKARSAREGFGDVSHRSAERVRHASSNVSQLAHEQPLLLGIIGLAAGAIVGAMIPPTPQEDALMGSASDRIKEQATEAGREQMEKAKQVASAAAETARQESERQLH